MFRFYENMLLKKLKNIFTKLQNYDNTVKEQFEDFEIKVETLLNYYKQLFDNIDDQNKYINSKI